jgi:hypothetical protein
MCGEPWELCITHLCDSELLKVRIGDLLREERVQRNLLVCEPLHEDVGLFVNLNLGIKSCVSRMLLPLLTLLLILTFLSIQSCVRTSLLSSSLVVIFQLGLEI